MSWSSVAGSERRTTQRAAGDAATKGGTSADAVPADGRRAQAPNAAGRKKRHPHGKDGKQKGTTTDTRKPQPPRAGAARPPVRHTGPAAFAAAPANAWGRAAETKERLGVPTVAPMVSPTFFTTTCPTFSSGTASEKREQRNEGETGTVGPPTRTCPDPSGSRPDGAAARAAFSALAGGLKGLDDAGPVGVEPVGMENPGNVCFANSVIQALLGCDLFRALLLRIRTAGGLLDASADRYPVLKAMADIGRELQFRASPADVQPVSPAVRPSVFPVVGRNPRAMRVTLITKLVHESFNTRYKGEQRTRQIEQEDAHEFLHCLLDGMHKELLMLADAEEKAEKAGQGKAEEEGDGGADAAASDVAALRLDRSDLVGTEAADTHKFDDDKDDQDDGGGEWLTQSGKRAVKQQVVTAETVNVSVSRRTSAISELFEGMQATSIASRGNPPSVTMHPFLVVEIPLYDASIDTLEAAITSVMATETISGYRPAGGTGTACEASKSERFQSLPEVLVLHMMRFQFSGSSEKLNKVVRYGTRLRVKAGWMMAGSSNRDRRAEYELVATISHHGQSIARGHFTANVRHRSDDPTADGDSEWVNLNDELVRPIREDRVLNDVPYMLFFRRL